MIRAIFPCLIFRTRDEKIKSLEDAQTKYKSESVLLDQQNNEMRKKLRSLTVTMQSAGGNCFIVYIIRLAMCESSWIQNYRNYLILYLNNRSI